MRRAYVVVIVAVASLQILGCSRSPSSSSGNAGRDIDPVGNMGAMEAEAATAGADLLGGAMERQPLPTDAGDGQGPGLGGDKFDRIIENSFVAVQDAPLSTFSIDVDTAAYSKTRMYLMQHHRLPPADSVRIEELVNYFDYDYSPPDGEEPFAVHVEIADAPWRTGHWLARVGIKGQDNHQQRPRSNLVFLLDVSGSMDYTNKLPLVKQGIRMLATQLGENDRLAIVVYAGAAGMVLPSTPGDDRARILDSFERLHAGGSTNGGQGIQLAYQVAEANFINGGVNRVILCSDGDFNVGTTSTGALVGLAERYARRGVYLSVLGFGMGNHNDAMLEQLSNSANGNYAFIDSVAEARKVLCDQLNATLVTIAKDVKIQIEFNPTHIAGYRLIGYENRRLRDEEFDDDRRDAGEIGAGHTVTALYELVPTGEGAIPSRVGPLKYPSTPKLTAAAAGSELLTLKLRYKEPDAEDSKLFVYPITNAPQQFTAATEDFQFASAVAAFGMLLRDSTHRGDASFGFVLEIAESARGEDRHGYRTEFVELVRTAQRIANPTIRETSSTSPMLQPLVRARRQPVPARSSTNTTAPLRISGNSFLILGAGIVVLMTVLIGALSLLLVSLLATPSASKLVPGSIVRQPTK